MIERSLICRLDAPEDMDPLEADHCPVEPVVPGLHRDHCVIISLPFHAVDHIPHRGVPDKDPAEYFDPVKFTGGYVICNKAVKTQGFCFKRHPAHRCVPARVRIDSGIGDLHESNFA